MTRRRKGRIPDAPIVRADGSERWYYQGALHRDGDKPACTNEYGQFWFRMGFLHRDDDKPAIISTIAGRCWYRDGRMYRGRNKPVIISCEGHRFWVDNNGVTSVVVYPNGTVIWYHPGTTNYSRVLFPDGAETFTDLAGVLVSFSYRTAFKPDSRRCAFVTAILL